jgi:hypothetical protein
MRILCFRREHRTFWWKPWGPLCIHVSKSLIVVEIMSQRQRKQGFVRSGNPLEIFLEPACIHPNGLYSYHLPLFLSTLCSFWLFPYVNCWGSNFFLSLERNSAHSSFYNFVTFLASPIMKPCKSGKLSELTSVILFVCFLYNIEET